jgi:hypothetical protein
MQVVRKLQLMLLTVPSFISLRSRIPPGSGKVDTRHADRSKLQGEVAAVAEMNQLDASRNPPLDPPQPQPAGLDSSCHEEASGPRIFDALFRWVRVFAPALVRTANACPSTHLGIDFSLSS